MKKERERVNERIGYHSLCSESLGFVEPVDDMAVKILFHAALFWTLLGDTSLFSASEEVNVTAGQTVTLPCRAPKTIIVVEWSRADLESQHVFVCWDSQVLPEEQHPSFKDRVDLQDRQMKDGDVSVTLKNVTINDAGTYECRVQREDDSVELISIIYLSVAPPGPTGGHTEDGGKDGEGCYGLVAGLSVFGVICVVVVLVISGKMKKKNSPTGCCSGIPRPEQQPV